MLAVNDVSFDVRRGEVFTLIGPNGAGKTTVFNLISRIYNPTAGTLSYLGRNLADVAPSQIAPLGIARTFQNIELFEHATVLQNLLIGRHVHRRSNMWTDMLFLPSVREAERQTRRKVEEVIDLLELQHYRDQLVAGLPYGVRKVVELARALATRPRLLLLDEVLAGLNPQEIAEMIPVVQGIAQSGVTVLMIEHVMQAVMSLAQEVWVLAQGQLIAHGTPAEVTNNKAVVEAYLGHGTAERLQKNAAQAKTAQEVQA